MEEIAKVIIEKILEKRPHLTIIIGIVALIYLFVDCNIVSDSNKAINGHYYCVIAQEENWDVAKEVCEERGGHLVTINDLKEQEIVSNLIRDAELCWIGGKRTNEDGVWAWVTDESFEFENFSEGEPNNHGGYENALLMLEDGTWNDANKLQPYENVDGMIFICEWENKINIQIKFDDCIIYRFGMF